VREIASGSDAVFAPQCGLAPGFISIAANELIQHFDTLRSVKLRVGALPQHPNNVLKYSLTWSTDGIINEYGNPCNAIVNGRETSVLPLEGLETIEIDGQAYEAFNTSGGLGSLADTYGDRVTTMNYKTIRYRGHCEQMRLLMNGLRLNDDRPTLKRILENAVPETLQDVVIIYAAVTGHQDGQFREENYVNKVYPRVVAGRLWSAIQITTAAGICSVVDIVLNGHDYQGFVAQEQFRLSDILNNRFGAYYAHGGSNLDSAKLVARGETGHQRICGKAGKKEA
jgi:saccharopine dehydrogenase-like NADP-dependent oxidoreductase